MSAAWIEELVRAARSQERRTLMQLIDGLPGEQGELAGILRELVRQLRLETIASVAVRSLSLAAAVDALEAAVERN